MHIEKTKSLWQRIKGFDQRGNRWLKHHSRIAIFTGGTLIALGIAIKDYAQERIGAFRDKEEKTENMLVAQNGIEANRKMLYQISVRLIEVGPQADKQVDLKENQKRRYQLLEDEITALPETVEAANNIARFWPELRDTRVKEEVADQDRLSRIVVDWRPLAKAMESGSQLDQSTFDQQVKTVERDIADYRGQLLDRVKGIDSVGALFYTVRDVKYHVWLLIAGYGVMAIGFVVSFSTHHVTDKEYPEIKP